MEGAHDDRILYEVDDSHDTIEEHVQKALERKTAATVGGKRKQEEPQRIP